MVIRPKKLFEMARRVTSTRPKTKRVADKGHFVVYTMDGRRFMLPLFYLKSEVFRDLFRMAEEEFGVPSDGPITLPCDSVFMEYAMFLIRSHTFVDLKHTLLLFLADAFGIEPRS